MTRIGRRWIRLVILVFTFTMVATTLAQQLKHKRVPAEWEPQEAVWLQWPGRYEKSHEVAFAKMAAIAVRYQKLHILYDSDSIQDEARAAISKAGANPHDGNIVWHKFANDSAWMRDNGPVYVIEGDEMRVQNWHFNAWGGAFGSHVKYGSDNQVPASVARYLGLSLDDVDIVHERGNLEFNGVDTVMLNWTTIGDHNRNPGYTRERAEVDLKREFGVSQVVFIEGAPKGDLTKGHIDGIARFIDPTTVVVLDCAGATHCEDDSIFDAAAETIEAAGFTVIREPSEGNASYGGTTFYTNYMNWAVGNGFVIVVGFGNPVTDMAAKERIEAYFPGRDVHVVEMLSSWASGGGAHCHTNDQPAASTIATTP
jgi:agmatine deiminase